MVISRPFVSRFSLAVGIAGVIAAVAALYVAADRGSEVANTIALLSAGGVVTAALLQEASNRRR